jgi:phosphoglycolate phosphatase-like HAD superfamily hydrolase
MYLVVFDIDGTLVDDFRDRSAILTQLEGLNG